MHFNAIKQQFSCVDVAQHQLGLQLRQTSSNEWRGVSFTPGSHSTNDALSVTDSCWRDFSAGIGGSVLDLVAFMKFGSNDGRSLREAAKFLTGEDSDSGYWQRYAQQRDKLRADIQAWHETLLKDERALDYLHGRRITDTTIERFMLGLCDEHLTINGEYTHELRLMIPYYDMASEPFYYASRQLSWAAHERSPKYHKAKQNEFLRNGIFGLNTIPRNPKDCDTLCITEGAVDALTIGQANCPFLSPVCGSFGREHEPKVIEHCRKFRRVITAFDIDENGSGQGFTCHMGILFLNAGIMFSAVEGYGEGCKDVSDFFAAGGDISTLLDGAVNGYQFMSRYTFWEKKPVLLSESTPFKQLSANDRVKYLSEIKQFVYRLKTLLEPSEFNDVIITLCEYYPRDKIARFAEGPTAHEVLCGMRDKYLESRNLFYHGSIKHGEYWQYDEQGGYWYRMTDADMQASLSEFFKHEPDNKTITQLAMMVRLMVTREIMPDFNKKQVEVFSNGTLELHSGILREHRAEDYATWAHTFSYDATAQCPTYDAFLEQVADGQPSRIDFLDDLAAYALYPDCRLEKCFFLIGGGGNGKGTYLHTLEALFESCNSRTNSQSVTHIQPCNFDKPTERIGLESSVLNIAHEVDGNLKGCEPYLKAVISGDTLSGNHKFVDTRSFCPRAKLVCSSNAMITTRDASLGMRRKILFTKFAACFEGQADTNLKAKLRAELPGIFNRVYRAYQALVEREKTQGNHAIRESCDNAAYMAEFTDTANPVSAFWTEFGGGFVERREVPKAEVFDRYREFCERNSIYAGRENIFHAQLQKVLQDNGITYSVTRHREQNRQAYYYVFTQAQDWHFHPENA